MVIFAPASANCLWSEMVLFCPMKMFGQKWDKDHLQHLFKKDYYWVKAQRFIFITRENS